MKYWFVKGINLSPLLEERKLKGEKIPIHWRKIQGRARPELPELNGDFLYLILKGEVGVTVRAQSQRTLRLATLQAGEIFGLNWRVEGHFPRSFLAPLGEPEIIALEPEAARELIKDQQIVVFVRRGLRRIKLMQPVVELVRVSPVPRVTAVILKLSRGFGDELQGRVILHSLITPQVISSLAGLSLEFTYLILAGLRERKIIKIEEGKIIIESRVQLSLFGDLATAEAESVF